MFFKKYKKIHYEMASRLINDTMNFSDVFYERTLNYIPEIKKITNDDSEKVEKLKKILVIAGVGISYSVFSVVVRDDQKEINSLAGALEQVAKDNGVPEVFETGPNYFDTYQTIHNNSQDENYARMYGETVVCGFYDWDIDSSDFNNLKQDSGIIMAIGSSLRTKYLFYWLCEPKYYSKFID